jgi:hypothetical protein
MHILAGFSVPLFIVAAGILAWINPWFLLWLICTVLLTAVVSFALAAVSTRSLAVGFNMPLVLAIFFVAWSFGYIHELFFPSKKR